MLTSESLTSRLLSARAIKSALMMSPTAQSVTKTATRVEVIHRLLILVKNDTVAQVSSVNAQVHSLRFCSRVPRGFVDFIQGRSIKSNAAALQEHRGFNGGWDSKENFLKRFLATGRHHAFGVHGLFDGVSTIWLPSIRGGFTTTKKKQHQGHGQQAELICWGINRAKARFIEVPSLLLYKLRGSIVAGSQALGKLSSFKGECAARQKTVPQEQVHLRRTSM